MSFVPSNVRPFVEILGETATLDFLLKFGGSRVYLARNPGPKSPVAACLGRAKATELGQACGPGHVDIPAARRWIALQLDERGQSGYEIARTLHTDSRTVRRWLAAKDTNQLDLFPSD